MLPSPPAQCGYIAPQFIRRNKSGAVWPFCKNGHLICLKLQQKVCMENINLLSEEEWRMIHNALSAAQFSTDWIDKSEERHRRYQQLMDKVRDNYIQEPQPCELTSLKPSSKS